ncbi:MAG: amidase family protein [Candidatus Hodarchaeales archaeon]|jgi:aspartyl-tRNA(Asn)/glutamyl-tRNA(Gln) amidotransferase subunit A
MKEIQLWSINDYKKNLSSEKPSLMDVWEPIFHDLKKDPYNVFIQTHSKLNTSQKKGLLSSIPISIKDNICTKDLPTSCASKMLKDWIPSYDASVVDFLKSEGAIIVGKTNLDEFAMGNTTETSYFGPSYNPWDEQKRFSPGGSSGGAAVCVALGYTPVALASDTGGSIRCPASWTGVLGLKPTYGRVSRYGLVSYAHTLDQIGILGRYAEDISLILEVISRNDSKDMTYENKPYSHSSIENEQPLTIGIIQEFFNNLPVSQQKIYTNALSLIEKIPNIQLDEVSIPDWDVLLPTYYTIASGEAYSNLARYTGEQYGYKAEDLIKTRLTGFGDEVLRRIKIGQYSLKKGFEEQLYNKAQAIREHFKTIFNNYFKKYSVIALPTMEILPLAWEETPTSLESYKSDILTVPANLLGIPALSIPIGFSKKKGIKFPIGLQLYSSWWNEHLLLQIAREFQQKTDFHLQLPPHQLLKPEV